MYFINFATVEKVISRDLVTGWWNGYDDRRDHISGISCDYREQYCEMRDLLEAILIILAAGTGAIVIT